MTTHNDTLETEPQAGRRGSIVDALLAELKDDQGGARRAALKRALEIDAEGGPGAAAVESEDVTPETTGDATETADAAVESTDEPTAGVTPTHNDVRIERLQSTVESIAAYTDALEAFLDENGTARAVLTDVQDGLDRTRDEVDALETELDTLERDGEDRDDRLAELSAEVETIDEVIDGIDHRTETLEDRVNEIESTLDSQSERLESAIEDLESLADDIEAIEEWQDSLETAFQ